MGIFSTKKTVQVSSTLYNLAGEVEGRPNFLKSNIFSHVIGDGKRYLGDTLATNYLNGPGIQQRQLQAWAVRNNYEGVPEFSIRTAHELDLGIIRSQIPVPSSPDGLITEIQSAVISDGDFIYFAEKHILDNSPELFSTDWVVDYDKEDHELVIRYEDTSTEYVDAGIYDPDKQFIVAYYYHYVPEYAGSYEEIESDTGEVVYANLPDNSSYDFLETTDDDDTQSFSLEEKVTEVREYSDSTPTTTTVNSTFTAASYDVETSTYDKVDYYGSDSGESVETSAVRQLYIVEEKRHVVVVTVVTTETNDMGGGVTETVTTTTETDTLEPIWDWSKQNQDLTYNEIEGGYQMFIYELGGTNTVLNALHDVTFKVTPEFYPFIPVRLNNISITDTVYQTNGLYDSSRKAYRKAFGKNGFAELIENVEDNEDLGDIDYAYICYGVPLNVIENASKKYLFEFFDNMTQYQNTTPAEVTGFQSRIAVYETAIQTYRQWLSDQENGGGGTGFGTDRPNLPVLSVPEITTIQLKTTSALTQDYDNRLSWYSIDKESIPGLGKIDAKRGDVWLEKGSKLFWSYQKASNIIETSEEGDTLEYISMDVIYIYKQLTDTTHEKMTIYGLLHNNFIYGGKSVEIGAHSALDDEEESGFLVPLHDPTLRSMRLVDSTQMSTANTYIVFNSYQIVKQKWYQSTIFQVVVVIIAIVISIVTYGAGSPLSAGLLGANATVGTALGFTGAAAIAVGAAANALAAIVLSQVLQYGARELLGDQLGGIIGAVVAFIAITAMTPGGLDFSNLLSAQNVLEFSSVLANGYKDWVQADLLKISQELSSLQSQFEDQTKYISSMLSELGGINDLSFNPLELTNVIAGNDSQSGDYIPESLEEFIHRTTLVGSEIVDVTLAMVSDYPELSLMLPKN